MQNKKEIAENTAQKSEAKKEKELIQARYDFLLSEQPTLQTIQKQRLITSVLGGCMAVLLPMCLDFINRIQNDETVVFMALGFFTVGAILTHYIERFIIERNNKWILVNNLETLQGWTRPIILLPYDRLDPSVDARANEIRTILENDKCVNHLHIALENAEMSFNYSIQYGFRTGETCQTEKGLPVVALFPELFVLRGAFDKKVWYDFQKEAVRIALEIDNEFAKYWHTLEAEKYRSVAGGQLTT